jgi:hypothetical protein
MGTVGLIVLRILIKTNNVFTNDTADSTFMKYSSQAIDRCRETALPCPLSLLCTSLT